MSLKYRISGNWCVGEQRFTPLLKVWPEPVKSWSAPFGKFCRPCRIQRPAGLSLQSRSGPGRRSPNNILEKCISGCQVTVNQFAIRH